MYCIDDVPIQVGSYMDNHVHSFQCHFGCCFCVCVLVLSRMPIMPYSVPKIQPPNAIRLRLPAGRLQQHRYGKPILPFVDHFPKTMLFDIYPYMLPEGQNNKHKTNQWGYIPVLLFPGKFPFASCIISVFNAGCTPSLSLQSH